MDGAKLAVIDKATAALERWGALHDGSVQLINNFGNVLQRLPALAQPRNYDGLASPQKLQAAVQAAQALSLNNVLTRLHAIMDDLGAVVRQQERFALDAAGALGQNSDACLAGTPVSSTLAPAQMVEAIEDAWFMCRDELCLKAAIVSELSPGMAPNEFEPLRQIFCACVNVGDGRPSVLALRQAAACG
ncbi:hypothetical protein FOA52_012664 [Chlamydomonas sp. UWO 241]|nr:hypothetical protein FOA52_012664 [Chlamydomonas sp. UWO 241]